MESVFGVIAGLVFVILGITIILGRKTLSKFTADGQRATFGKAGDKLASQASPVYPAVVGGGFVIIGAALAIVMLSGAEI